MTVLTDEVVLNVDGFVSSNPVESLRPRAQEFLASRRWTSTQIFFGDQAEAEEGEIEPLWSFCFCIGLDNLDSSNGKWRDDVAALLAFLKELPVETEHEMVMDVRIRSKPWYSGHIAFVDEMCPALDKICDMIETTAKSGRKLI
jgi:hypothetical protein